MNTPLSQTKQKPPVTVAFSTEKQVNINQLAAFSRRSHSLEMQDRVIDVLRRLRTRRINGNGRRSVIGLWYDTLLQRVVCEPSYFFFVGTSLARAATFAADIGAHYGQQAVLLAQENPDGNDAIHQITFVSQEKAFAASRSLPSYDINNATMDGPLIWIGDPDNQLSSHVARFYAFAVECGATELRTTRAEIVLVWSRDYETILAMMDANGDLYPFGPMCLRTGTQHLHDETGNTAIKVSSYKVKGIPISFVFAGARDHESFLTVSYRVNTQHS